jgi:hypothetical protein
LGASCDSVYRLSALLEPVKQKRGVQLALFAAHETKVVLHLFHESSVYEIPARTDFHWNQSTPGIPPDGRSGNIPSFRYICDCVQHSPHLPSMQYYNTTATISQAFWIEFLKNFSRHHPRRDVAQSTAVAILANLLLTVVVVRFW